MTSHEPKVFAPRPGGGPPERPALGKGLVVLLVALFLALCTPRRAAADDDAMARASRASEMITALDLDRARAELAKGDPNAPPIVVAKARLALYEEDCDLAAAILAHPDDAIADDAHLVADVAKGCARVIAATVVERDDAAGVVVRFHDEADRALFPMIVESVASARTALSRDLGVTWKKPTKITVVRDLLSLSAMTGLPYKAAQTTGTVAVAKWGRVTILSPRASRHGFPFRDTIAHELTHLAISMQTLDRAPLWLHEGVARREEARWREPGPFDDRPSPESIVVRGMELKLDLPLDKLGPSIAMLPSADAAMVAFAEVTSFIKFFVESSGPDALPKLLVALRTARSADEALKRVGGESLAQWDVRWRAMLAKKPKEALSPLYGLGALPAGMGDSRERARLAELLFARHHAKEAVAQLEKIPETMYFDPSLRYLKARALEDGNLKQAEGLLEDPKVWSASFGPCWGMRGRLARARGDEATAASSFMEAVAHDPLGVEGACETLGPELPKGEKAPLCEAARNRGEPDLGED